MFGSLVVVVSVIRPKLETLAALFQLLCSCLICGTGLWKLSRKPSRRSPPNAIRNQPEHFQMFVNEDLVLGKGLWYGSRTSRVFPAVVKKSVEPFATSAASTRLGRRQLPA